MRKTYIILAWGFILVVAAYDVYFAWEYRDIFEYWEMNPAARWVAGIFGLWTVFALKAALLGFAACVAAYCYRLRHWLCTPYTAVASGAHVLLSLQYIVGNLR